MIAHPATLLFVVVALLGTLSGGLFAYADDLPEISALDTYQPNTITRLFARDGQVIDEFAIERAIREDLSYARRGETILRLRAGDPPKPWNP